MNQVVQGVKRSNIPKGFIRTCPSAFLAAEETPKRTRKVSRSLSSCTMGGLLFTSSCVCVCVCVCVEGKQVPQQLHSGRAVVHVLLCVCVCVCCVCVCVCVLCALDSQQLHCGAGCCRGPPCR